MSYIKDPELLALPGLLPAERTVVQLDSGEVVALRQQVSRQAQTNVITFLCTARALTPDGQAVLDAHGQPVSAAVTYSAPASDNPALQAFLLQQLALAQLGEPLSATAPAWSPEFLRDASIRTALAAARATGDAPSLMSLL